MPKDIGAPAGAAAKNGRVLSDCAALFTRERIHAIASNRISTGFPELDRSLGGGLTNGLYVLGAVPGLGKSTLALQIAYHLSSQGIPVLYFALEMNWTWITAKSLCRTDFMLHHQAGFRASDLLDANRIRAFSPEEWERVRQARERLERDGSNFYLYEQEPELSHIGHIQQRIAAFQAAHREQYQGLPLMVVVDYLQILAPREAALKASDKQIVDDNVRELCKIRDQQKAIILLISSLNRASYKRPITLDSFKESGSIEYSADAILGMQYQGLQEDERRFSQEAARARDPRELELILLKMRYGQDGIRIPLHFYSASSFFQQPDGERAGTPGRLLELREQLRDCPVQYHDGFYQRARQLKRG